VLYSFIIYFQFHIACMFKPLIKAPCSPRGAKLSSVSSDEIDEENIFPDPVTPDGEKSEADGENESVNNLEDKKQSTILPGDSGKDVERNYSLGYEQEEYFPYESDEDDLNQPVIFKYGWLMFQNYNIICNVQFKFIGVVYLKDLSLKIGRTTGRYNHKLIDYFKVRKSQEFLR